jgi:hypothetical protein
MDWGKPGTPRNAAFERPRSWKSAIRQGLRPIAKEGDARWRQGYLGLAKGGRAWHALSWLTF